MTTVLVRVTVFGVGIIDDSRIPLPRPLAPSLLLLETAAATEPLALLQKQEKGKEKKNTNRDNNKN